MEQKSKRIGKLNIIDLIAIVLIALVLVFVAWKLVGRGAGGDGAANMVHVTYTVKCEGVDASLYENCKQHLPSTLMASGILYNGQIESVEQEPFLVLGPDGQWSEDPAHVNLYFTVTLDVPEAAVQMTKVGDQEVRVGKSDYILKSEYIEFSNVVITDVVWEKD